MYPKGFLNDWRCKIDPRTLYKIMYLYYKVGTGPTELAKRYSLQSNYVSQVVRGQSASTKRVLDAVNVDINFGIDRSNCYPYHSKEEIDQAYDKATEAKDKEEMSKKSAKKKDRKARMTYEQAIEVFRRYLTNSASAKELAEEINVHPFFFAGKLHDLRKLAHRRPGCCGDPVLHLTYSHYAALEALEQVGDQRAAPNAKKLSAEDIAAARKKLGNYKPAKKSPKKTGNPKVNRVNPKSVPSPRYFEENGVIMVEETVVQTRTRVATVEEITKLAIHSL